MIDLTNSKAKAGRMLWLFPEHEEEWKTYLQEHPEVKMPDESVTPDSRFVNGKSALDVFRETVEYIPRSLMGRPLQTWIARQLIALLNEEEKYSVLDYGGGAGNIGFLFAQAGFNVDIVEVKGVHTDFLKWRAKRHFLNIEILGEDDPLDSYELVILFNVLEHMLEPLAKLKRITESLVTGGYLAMLFNSHGHGLDVTSMQDWEKTLKPYILDNYVVVPNTDSTLYRKI